MSGIKKALRWLNTAITAALALLLCVNLYFISARLITGKPQPTLFGWSWAVIISGSMEPEISIHDLVVAHRQDSYAIGDVITYESESGRSIITHRIIDTAPEGYITRGDANNAADLSPVPQDKVVGRVVKVMPRIGIFLDYLRTPLGLTCIVLLGILLIELPHHLPKAGRKE